MIGERLRQAREARGLTQEAAAELSDCYGSRDIQRYEHGEVIPKISSLIRLCNAYSISIDWVLGRDTRNHEPMEDDLTPSDMVYYLRKRNGLLITRLSELSGVPYSSISKIERGGDMQACTAIRLADSFKVSVDYICGRGQYEGL